MIKKTNTDEDDEEKKKWMREKTQNNKNKGLGFIIEAKNSSLFTWFGYSLGC